MNSFFLLFLFFWLINAILCDASSSCMDLTNDVINEQELDDVDVSFVSVFSLTGYGFTA